MSEWDVSNVTKMSYMFCGASSFNQDVSEWDVSNVTNMSYMFCGAYASSFNQDVSDWDVSNVTNMSYIFHGASSFNQDISEWDVSNVTNMSDTFHGASSFNQDISEWDVSNVTNMSYMFYCATILVEDLQIVAGVSSYFEGQYCRMNRTSRRRAFARIFRWDRRKCFVMFLVGQQYLLSLDVEDGPRTQLQNCDILFDVEDIDRVICNYL